MIELKLINYNNYSNHSNPSDSKNYNNDNNSNNSELNIKYISSITTLAKNNILPVTLKNYFFDIAYDKFNGLVLYCSGVCGNLALEEELLTLYALNQTENRCIFLEDKQEKLNFLSKILLYEKMYQADNLNKFIMLIVSSENVPLKK